MDVLFNGFCFTSGVEHRAGPLPPPEPCEVGDPVVCTTGADVGDPDLGEPLLGVLQEIQLRSSVLVEAILGARPARTGAGADDIAVRRRAGLVTAEAQALTYSKIVDQPAGARRCPPPSERFDQIT